MGKKRIILTAGLLSLALAASPAFAAPGASPKAAPTPVKNAAHALNQTRITGAQSSQANWRNIASMGQGVLENGGGATIGRNLYVPGGYIDFTPTLFNQMQIYNAQTNTWTIDAEMIPSGQPGWADAAVCADPTTRKIHLVNGTLDGTFLYTAHAVYDTLAPLGSRWSLIQNPNTPVDGNYYSQDSGCSFIGGKLYLYGGYGLTDSGGTADLQRLTWVYDPATDTWSDTGKLMIRGRVWQGYATSDSIASSDSIAFVAGGSDLLFVPIATAERFSPGPGWVALPDLPAGRIAPGMGLIIGTIAVWGGGDSTFTPLASTFMCAPGCASWTNANRNLNTPRWFHAWGSMTTGLFAAGGTDAAGPTLSSAERTP